MLYIIAVNSEGEPWEFGRARTVKGAVQKLLHFRAVRHRVKAEGMIDYMKYHLVTEAEGKKEACDFARLAFMWIPLANQAKIEHPDWFDANGEIIKERVAL